MLEDVHASCDGAILATESEMAWTPGDDSNVIFDSDPDDPGPVDPVDPDPVAPPRCQYSGPHHVILPYSCGGS